MAAGLTAIVDYGLCNIDSIARALEDLGATVEKTRDPRIVDDADRIVLPGVGAFGTAMANLTRWRLAEAILARLDRRDVPFLGICLGMQLMATRGEEHGEHAGLGLISGRVTRLMPANADERVPHIGWNEVHAVADAPLFAEVAPGSDFYFVHSYHLVPESEASTAARTPYCGGIVSAVFHPDRPIFGTQFHPEKSQRPGKALLSAFLGV